MVKRRIIALDIDDVIIDLVPQWLRVFNMVYHNENLKPEDITDWDIQSFAKNKKHDIFEVLKKWHDYNLCYLIENSLEGVKFLRSLGNRVIFITSTPEEHRGIKLKYLNDRGFDILGKDYFETSNKWEVKKDFLLDDNIKNVLSEKTARGIIFTRNWNKSFDYPYRADSWIDFMNKWSNGDFDK